MFLPDDGDSDSLIPPQSPHVSHQIIHKSFPAPAHHQSIELDLAVDASPGCGGVVWPAGEVLANYLIHKSNTSHYTSTILELGSGTGLVGLIAASLYPTATVYITDQKPMLDLMLQNVQLNNLNDSVKVMELEWGSPITSPLLQNLELVLAADCVYFEPSFPLLVQTLKALTDHNHNAQILFCYKKRRKADKRFFSILRKDFRWVDVTDDPDRESYSRDAISLLRVTRKDLGITMAAD